MELRNVLNEMVEQAALEIGFPFEEGCTEYVELLLLLNHNIKLNEVEVTWQIMNTITQEVKAWQEKTKLYF